MSDQHDDDLSDDEIAAIVQAALGELLNMAAGVAELQTTDEAAEEIYAICDLVAEYHGIEHAKILVEENPDGSYTTRFEDNTAPTANTVRTETIPGHIRTKGKVKYRIINSDNNNKPKSK
jgi:hypothetical protein